MSLRAGFISSCGSSDTGNGVTLMCARYWPDRHGGVEKRLWHVSRALAERGVPVKVLTENRVGAPDIEVIQPNLTVRRVAPIDMGRFWRWPSWPRVRWWREAITRYAADRSVLWATDPAMGVAALTSAVGVRGVAGRRVVYNPAGCIAGMRQIARIHEQVTTMDRPRHLVWLDRYGYRHASRVVVSSNQVRDQFESFYGKHCSHRRVSVVPHGVEAPSVRVGRRSARARFGLGRDDYVVGAVGRLDPCKGLDDLIDAFSMMPCKSGTRLLVVGDGPDRRRLHAIAELRGVVDRVVWAGHMDDPATAYAAMDVLALPSVYEAFGNVLLEAMSHGVPVVGRRGNGTNAMTACDQIIDDGRSGLLFDPLSTADLVGKLTWLRDRPESRLEMSKLSVRQALTRPWRRVAEDYLALLGECRGVGEDALGEPVAA